MTNTPRCSKNSNTFCFVVRFGLDSSLRRTNSSLEIKKKKKLPIKAEITATGTCRGADVRAKSY